MKWLTIATITTAIHNPANSHYRSPVGRYIANAMITPLTLTETSAKVSRLRFRHPERSEAKDFLFLRHLARAQSKDQADLIRTAYSEWDLLDARQARRPFAKRCLLMALHATRRPYRSFDSGSARTYQEEKAFRSPSLRMTELKNKDFRRGL